MGTTAWPVSNLVVDHQSWDFLCLGCCGPSAAPSYPERAAGRGFDHLPTGFPLTGAICASSARPATSTAVSKERHDNARDSDGDGTFEVTTTDVTIVNGDGSRTETIIARNADASLRSQSVINRCL
jgi:hypothetical protein